MTRKKIISNIIPSIVVELMILIYNLADTFFIAQTNDPLQVAAVSLSTPAFMVLGALGVIFMVGGLSCISRALGAKRKFRADNIASFTVWTSIITGIITSIILILFMKNILNLIGASPDTFEFAYNYLMIVTCSGPVILFNLAASGIMRSENHAGVAMAGQIIGNIVNIILDPIMILYFNWGITGAAIATVIGNICGGIYYVICFILGKSSLSISIKKFRCMPGVFYIGIPACLDPILMSVSQMTLNSLISNYGDMPVAANGVAMKINQIVTLIAMGTGQGVQPLMGFCIGAKDLKNYKKVLYFALRFITITSLILIGTCYFFAPKISAMFLTEPSAFKYSVDFTRIFLSSSLAFGIFFVFTNSLQAMGAGRASFILSVCRQLAIYIPAMYILNYFAGEYGLIWALPVAEVISLAQTFFIYGKIIFNPFKLNEA